MSETARPTIPTPESRRPLVPVAIPAWGVTLYVRRLSMADSLALPDDDSIAWTRGMLLASTCYEDGTRVWQDSDAEQVLAYPGEDLKPLLEQAVAVNGITKTTVEDRKGNSDGGPSDSSSSDSPASSEG